MPIFLLRFPATTIHDEANKAIEAVDVKRNVLVQMLGNVLDNEIPINIIMLKLNVGLSTKGPWVRIPANFSHGAVSVSRVP
jgi:hypothetical protein